MTIKIKEALQNARAQLKSIIAVPQLEAETLLSHVLGITRTKLWTENNELLNSEQEQQFAQLIARRLAQEPLAYLIETKEFWSLRLRVTPATLIPREETEVLVRQALCHIPVVNEVATTTSLLPLVGEGARRADEGISPRILDLGTGSGAIAIALASERPQAEIIAVDKNATALEVAKENARTHHCNNITFILSDWFHQVPASLFDLIVSNPPYIAVDDPALEDSVRLFEPASAYIAANQGLSDIEIIITQAKTFLKPDGWLLIEHGYLQAAAVQKLFAQAGFDKIATIQDLNGLDRVTMAKLRNAE